MCSTIFRCSVTRHSRRRFGSSPTTRSGEDHRPPVGPVTRWSHRGAIQDALGGTSNRPGSGKWTFTSLTPTFCVIEPALRTSTAKPTAFTAGCALARHSESFPGTTANVFWRRATLASHAQSGFAATATRCSPREPTFDTRATMGCGGLAKSMRVRRKMEYIWFNSWTTRGGSIFLSLRRATRPQRGPYEVLGASRSTEPARSLGESNVT